MTEIKTCRCGHLNLRHREGCGECGQEGCGCREMEYGYLIVDGENDTYYNQGVRAGEDWARRNLDGRDPEIVFASLVKALVEDSEAISQLWEREHPHEPRNISDGFAQGIRAVMDRTLGVES